MTPMKISAIVTCYESTATIGLTLMSLFGQTRQPDEIIVTDDGSSESTCEFIDEILGTISVAGDIHCDFVTHERTTPYRLNTIRNDGIEAASGELLFLVDGDILVPRGFLFEHERIHEGILTQGGSAFVSCVRKNITRGGEISEGRNSEWGHKLDQRLLSHVWSELDLEPEETLSQATFLKNDWERVGRFDTDFDGHWGFDEIEFAWRLKQAGVRLTCHGLVYHVDEGPGAGNRDAGRNRLLYQRKTQPRES
jgi:glycosyltransferase involved in cell wall biosynthesis